MRIEDVMTTEVLTADVEMPLKEVAEILTEHRISGLPVVGANGDVVGVVSEADILEKESGPLEHRHRIMHAREIDQREAKVRAHTAGTAMTAPAITIGPGRTLVEAARTMTEHHVNRLPVIDDAGALIGIVTRADLVRAFVRPDEEIEHELREDVAQRTLWIDPSTLQISVERGEVVLAGEVESNADAELLERFARRVPGVVDVVSQLRWRVEDPKLPAGNPRVPRAPRR
jgi:CBS domain-containing protein